jgi:glycosyltransferase involved in cell wall biosynthesis
MLDHPSFTPRNMLLITPQLDSTSFGGRELLSKLNRDALNQLYGNKFSVLELARRPMQGFVALLCAVKGQIDGVDEAVIQRIVIKISDGQSWDVFLDGSNLGSVARRIRRSCLKARVVTFFHNCEVRFFWGAFRQSKSLHSLGVFVANYLAERFAVRYSDKRICLSQRDSSLIEKIYGRGATDILPMAMEDRASGLSPSSGRENFKPMMLFVGGTFYANQAGISWFVENVVPRVAIPLCIVGRGFENYRDLLEVPGKVRVVGAVDDLSEWYEKASFVVAPIFDGSGMKTKVAEALMHGKRVIGTAEAFSGYDGVERDIGWICNTCDEFVMAIEDASNRALRGCDPELRKLYLDHYSVAAARERIRKILQ